MLPDGDHDAIVFDVDERPDGLVVELTLLAGEHKGEVVSVRTTDWTGDPLDLLAVPATVSVVEGTPSVRFEDQT